MDLSNLLPAIEDACGLRELLEPADERREPAALGLSDAAKAAVIAALARRTAAPTLVIVPKPQQALALVEELGPWLGDALPVLPFPERDAFPYERLLPDPEALRERLLALHALHEAQPCVVVTSGAALAQRTLPKGALERTVPDLLVGARSTPEKLLQSLLAYGYRVVPLVELAGDAARRGGIVDAFPATESAPIRIEFLGDRIESLRYFDPETQRSGDALDAASFGPAREVIDLPAAAGTLAREIDLSRCGPETRERYEEELSRLQAGDALPDEAFYVPFLASGSLLEHLPQPSLTIVDEPADLAQALEEYDAQTEETRKELEARGELPVGLPSPHATWEELRALLDDAPRPLHLSRWAAGENPAEEATVQETPPTDGPASLRLPFAPANAYGGRLRTLAADVAEATARGHAVVIVSQQAQRLAEVLDEYGVPAALTQRPDPPQPGMTTLVAGALAHGWRLTSSQPPLTVLSDAEVLGFFKKRRRAPSRSGQSRDAFLAALGPGDYVAHIEHGIARFAGMVRRTIGDVEREYLELHYADGDRLYVPAEQVDRLSRYVGPSDREPALTRLGSQEWSRAKARVRRAVAELAHELLELYAARELLPGRAVPPDTPWQQELEASFPYVETADQLAAVEEVKADMERPRPMDRLVCGDVGYGKTEVAVRAAFKAVMNGTQVAILVPTTVLAQQHLSTFRERLAGFPARIEMLSRFRSEREQRSVVEALGAGAVDIVIGTHRLLQKDVSFKDLGLVVIDEEHRFGVVHKERLKRMRRDVDVMTMSATPIPRTLYISLAGVRDMSTIDTPPEDRLPIKTYVSEDSAELVREAILREIDRGGQVFFVHNRVKTIDRFANELRKLVPEASIGIGHGQMVETELESVMAEFTAGEFDVLLSTTIIESGLDLPNVNTLIVDRADRFGLSQLYQLRGRIGRGTRRAYAYFLVPRGKQLTETAEQRLNTIMAATELGAGYQIAMRDLEIRGAGNILGAEQSGHIHAVGFDLYNRLLALAV
ncbi:MAG: transcription-repair coupling factor, partial [Chloroflexi bacterium]|nr:transcription-repair coupling factor [Chloroflexota bacterium]